MNNSEIIRKTQQKAKQRFKASRKTKVQEEQVGIDKAISIEAYKIASVMYDRHKNYKNNIEYYRKNSKFKD